MPFYMAPFQHHFDTLLTSVFVSMMLDSVTLFFSRQKHKKHKHVFDGRKLEESEGYNYLFIIFYVLESK